MNFLIHLTKTCLGGVFVYTHGRCFIDFKKGQLVKQVL
jgi:hypothetical protein